MGKRIGMDTQRWQKVEHLFSRLADLPRMEQEHHLQQLARKDEPLAAELRALLDEDADPYPLLKSEVVRPWPLEEDAQLTGSRIGAFTLERWMGAGGMGSVFEARRADGEFDQQVAIKLMRPGRWSEQALASFRQERQILAQLQHPHIARLYDGGISEEGRPYFTMELVNGVPLTDYAREQGLSLRERLRLFLQVCEAIRYAHQKLIVHLDLKPANILVEASGQVKLLDFGISRLLADRPAEGGAERLRAFTLPYAAPEVIRGVALGTQADVYSLGLILYELLAEVHPYAERAASAPSPQALVEQYEPQTPSLERSPRSRELQGDLDAIVLKAMQKRPEDRYPSVEALQSDLHAHLHHYPVSARQGDAVYRLGKYLARHRTAVGLSGFFGLALLATGLFYTIELNRQRRAAVREAERAEQIKELTLGLFEQADPGKAQQPNITVREVLDGRLSKLEQELRDQPDMLLDMYQVIGDAYLGLNLLEKSERTFRKALALSDSLYQRPHPRIAEALLHLGALYGLNGMVQADVADSLSNLGYQMLQRSRENDPRLEAFALVELAGTAYDRPDYPRADSLFRQGLARYRALPGDFRDEIAYCLHMIGTTRRKLKQWEEAEDYLLQAHKAYEELYEPPHSKLAVNLNHLASLYLNRNQPERAEPYAREAWAQRKQVFGKAHMETIASLSNLGRIYRRMERWDEALAAYTEALAQLKTAVGETHPYVAALTANVAGVQAELGRIPEAERLYRKSVALQDQALPPGDFRRSYGLHRLGKLLVSQERPGEALPFLVQALEIRTAHLPEGHVDAAAVQSTLGECLLALGRTKRAQAHLQAAVNTFTRDSMLYEEPLARARSLLSTSQ